MGNIIRSQIVIFKHFYVTFHINYQCDLFVCRSHCWYFEVCFHRHHRFYSVLISWQRPWKYSQLKNLKGNATTIEHSIWIPHIWSRKCKFQRFELVITVNITLKWFAMNNFFFVVVTIKRLLETSQKATQIRLWVKI